MQGSRTYGSAELNRASKKWLLAVGADAATRAKRIFPKIPPEAQGVLPLSDTPANCQDLLWFTERYPIEMSAEDRAYLETRAAAKREEVDLVGRILAAGYKPPMFPLLKPLREYQALAVDLCLRSGHLLVADQLGLGKTVMGIGILSDPRARPGLVVCPTHLPTHWRDKIAEFMGPDVLVHILQKGTPYDLVEKCGRMPDVIITNYHKLAGWAQTLAESGAVRSVVYDEVQDLRHTETKKYEAAAYLRDHVSISAGFSGSPIYNYGGELHAVMSAIADDCLGTAEEFAREWCGGATGRKATVTDTAALNAHLRREGLMVRRQRADVGRELPALTSIVHVIDTDGKALAEEEASIANLAEVLCAEGGRGIDKMQAAAEFDMRLRQLTGVDKAPFAAQFIRMLAADGQRVLAFAWHRAVHDILLEKLGPGQKDEDGDEMEDLHPKLYTGSENSKQKDLARDAFVSGESRVLIMSLRSGTGVDGLQHVCSTAVFCELDWAPAVHIQGVGRVHRDGQTQPVFAYTLLSEEGSDPIVADVLGIKAGQFEGLFNPTEATTEDQQAPVDRVKLVARKFLEQQKAKKARPPEPRDPRVNAPANLRPDVTVASPRSPAVVAKAPTPKAPPPPKVERWVALPAKAVTADVEKKLIEAGIGVTAAEVERVRRRHVVAHVGFAGSKIVAWRSNAI